MPRASALLLWAAYAAAAIGLVLGFDERSPVAGLRSVTLWTVGIMSVIIFLRRVAIARSSGGDDGHMQVGLAHLAWGVVALAMVLRQSSAPALIAVSLVFAAYLALSAAWRLAVLLRPGESRQPAAAFGGVAGVTALAAAIAWFAFSALGSSHG